MVHIFITSKKFDTKKVSPSLSNPPPPLLSPFFSSFFLLNFRMFFYTFLGNSANDLVKIASGEVEMGTAQKVFMGFV